MTKQAQKKINEYILHQLERVDEVDLEGLKIHLLLELKDEVGYSESNYTITQPNPNFTIGDSKPKDTGSYWGGVF